MTDGVRCQKYAICHKIEIGLEVAVHVLRTLFAYFVHGFSLVSSAEESWGGHTY